MKVLILKDINKDRFEEDINELTNRNKIEIIDIEFDMCFIPDKYNSHDLTYLAKIMYIESTHF